VWQIGAISIAGLLLAAAALAEKPERDQAGAAPPGWPTRAALALGTLAALWAIVVPLSTAVSVRASQAAVRKGDLRSALSDAATAQGLEPGAASPRLQRALIREQLGDIPAASQAIAQALAREPNNWRLWLVASRIATDADQPRLALADYRRAYSLNPTSPIFRR
jgi:Tfp pilus assembly protein PilF